jgi:membrane-bound ClpP family serine protease
MFQTTLTYIAWISSGLFCIQLIFLLIGADSHDGAVDMDADVTDLGGDHTSDLSFKILSFQSVVAFLMGFSWIGKACLEDWHLGKTPTILIASLFGFLIAGFFIFLMHLIRKLNSVNKSSLEECVGKSANVYMSLPKKGLGQVEIFYGGKCSILDAKGLDGEEISSGSEVLVVAVKDKILIVKKI